MILVTVFELQKEKMKISSIHRIVLYQNCLNHSTKENSMDVCLTCFFTVTKLNKQDDVKKRVSFLHAVPEGF